MGKPWTRRQRLDRAEGRYLREHMERWDREHKPEDYTDKFQRLYARIAAEFSFKSGWLACEDAIAMMKR